MSEIEPILVKLEANKNYAWCSCEKSASQPFCDGAHSGTDKSPLVFKLEEDKDAYLCVCKKTQNPPYCDGSHQ